jgi:hypothetical protein
MSRKKCNFDETPKSPEAQAADAHLQSTEPPQLPEESDQLKLNGHNTTNGDRG